MMYNNSKEELEKIKDVFRRIVAHLDMLVEKKELDAYDRALQLDAVPGWQRAGKRAGKRAWQPAKGKLYPIEWTR